MALACLLPMVGIVPAAQAQTVTATNGLSCLADRMDNPTNLGCTANDFSHIVTAEAISAPATCAAGSEITVSVQLTLQSNSTDRYDIGLFMGESGNNPAQLGGMCSVATFPESPAPFADLDAGTQPADTCGDFNANGSSTVTIQNVRLTCTAGADGKLVMPYTLAYSQNTGGVCTGPGVVRAGTTSKCTGGTASVSNVEVVGHVDVTKQTLPDAAPDAFAFTAVDGPNTSPSSFSLVDGGTQRVTTTFGAIGSSVTIDENVPLHWRASVACTSGNVDTSGQANGTFIANLTSAAPTASCTVTNTKRSRITLVKNIVGGRNNAADQFTVSGTGGGALTNSSDVTIPAPVSATTTGTGTTASVTFYSTPGSGLTLTDAMAAGSASTLADYTPTYTCINATTGSSTPMPSGTGATFALTPAPGDDITCTYTNTLIARAALVLDKRLVSGGAFDSAGDVIQYAYDVTNSGNVAISGPITVSDNKIASVSCPAGDLAAGAMITCTASYTVTQADLNNGSVTNIATASGSFNGQPVNSNQDTVTVEALLEAAITLAKTAISGDPYDSAGDVVQYEYVVTNSGNLTITDPITVADDKTTVTCPALPGGGLAPGGSVTCTASYTITQADVDDGSVTNVATATSGPVNSNQATETVTATRAPALTLAKTASPLVYDAAGDVIGYSYLLTNTGNVTLAAPYTVADDKTAVTCPATPSALAPGGTVTCTATYTITQADVNAGSVTNIATASSNFNGAPVTSNQDDATVTATQAASLSLVKTASPLVYDAAGDVISYSYLLTNTGNVTMLAPYTVADDKTAVACPATPATLPPGGMVTCTATYTITQADVNTGSVTNIATASSNFNGAPVTSNQDDATVTATQTAALTLDKRLVSGGGFDNAGDLIQYAYDVTNAGNVTISGPITVSDNKIATVTCPAGDLAPGAMITCTASYTVTQADINSGSVTNIATAAGTFNTEAVTSNQDSVTVEALQDAALTLVKTAIAGDPYAAAGDVVQYEYLVSNSGNVTITDPITVADDKTSVTCPALPGGGLAPGGAITCTASYTVTQADVDAGSVTNVATATSGTVSSNQATETVNATRSPSLGLEKTASPLVYAAAGDVISYSYLLTNTGNVTLSAPYTVADDKTTVTCPATPGTLAPGGTVTCTATYTITQADVNAGSVINLATASATFNSAAVNSAQDSATVTATQTPALSLDKRLVSGGGFAAVGDVVQYAYDVTNSGNVTISGPITVSDDKIASVTCPAGDLAPGALITCTASYTVTQADLNNGSVTNIATAAGSFNNQPVTSNPDTVTVEALQEPALALDKRVVSGNPYDSVGDVVQYAYDVTNTGNVIITDPITVSDDKIAAVNCPALPSGGLAPGAMLTCTASYTITQADINNGSVTNVATASSGTTQSPPDTVTVTATQRPALSLDKRLLSGTTVTAVGDVIQYAYDVRNTGNVTITGPITVSDDKIAVVTCPAGDLVPAEMFTCTASYTVTQADLDAGSITNIATASGTFNEQTVNSNQDSVTVEALHEMAIVLTKVAATREVRAGDLVRFTVVARNVGPGPVVDATLVDTPPRGFTFVEGSLTADDEDNSVVVSGVDPIRISGVDIATNGIATFVYFLRVGAGAGHGTHINRVIAMDPTEHAVSNEATAEVVIIGDPILEQSLIVGTVFDDRSGDGIQQPGERGIPGVRIGSVEGLIMETDAFGRYHLVGIDGGDFSRGRNFILKVDASTLPVGTKFTTENPRVRRITPGVPVRFDFGVRLPNGEMKGGRQELDAELGEVMFDSRSSTLKAEYLPVIEKVADKVREYNGGRIVITAKAEEESLAYARARAVQDALKATLEPALADRVVVDVVADSSGTMVRLDRGINLGTFLFDTDKSVIKPQYRRLIKEIADDLNRRGRGTIGLVGHADMRASNEYNRYLGLRRSKAVFDAILAQLNPEVRQRVRIDISDEIDAETGVGDR